MEQIPSFKSWPLFMMVSSLREANRKLQQLFPFMKIAEKHGAMSIYLKVGSCPNDDNFVQIFFLSFSVL